MQFVSHINLSFINDYCYINEIARPKQIKLIIGSVFHASRCLVARLCVIIDLVFGSAAYNSQNRYGKKAETKHFRPSISWPSLPAIWVSSFLLLARDPFANIRMEPFSRAARPYLAAKSIALARRASAGEIFYTPA